MLHHTPKLRQIDLKSVSPSSVDAANKWPEAVLNSTRAVTNERWACMLTAVALCRLLPADTMSPDGA